MTPHDLSRIIRERRSSLLIDPEREVDGAIITELCDVVQWAPNHKRTWPAQLAVLQNNARVALGNTVADVMAAQNEDARKVEKTRTKYLRAPVVIVVASSSGDSETRTRENTFAVAAGIQNMLLIAHQYGLACLWGSPADGTNDAIVDLCQFDSGSIVMGIVYVGWPTNNVPSVTRPPVRVRYLND